MDKLTATGIRKSYGAHEVLKGVSLAASAGDVISIIGSSGSGKSTLLRCLNFLESPNAGRIVVEGEELQTVRGPDGVLHPASARQLRQMRSRLAMVFQNFCLWSHMTVLSNVIEAPIGALGLDRKEALDRAHRNLEKVGLGRDHLSRYPGQLSGGQQQRVAIARALSMDPQVMLFDEPTSALDPELVGEVLKVMQSLAEEGRTMIVVTHEMAFARHASTQVIYLRDGLIEEQGRPAEIFGAPRSERLARFIERA